jgi:arylsulfatase A-like enzyme
LRTLGDCLGYAAHPGARPEGDATSLPVHWPSLPQKPHSPPGDHATGNGGGWSHLDGNNFMPFFKGEQAKGPRREIFYFDDNASLNAVRVDDWKIHFKIMAGNLASAQLKPLNMPQVINFREDPFERFPAEAQMYFRWYADKMWTFVPAQAVVGQFIESLKEFPPILKSGSFSVDQVLEQLQTTPVAGI